MPKIDALLVNPTSARMTPAFVPHGLLYIASFAMGQGYSISVYDRNVAQKGIDETLSETRPAVVGMGCLTGTSIDDAIYVSKRIKAFDPSIKVVWGGMHPTLYPDSVLSEDFADFVVFGDGEKAFTEILDSVIKNKIAPDKIENLGYKDGKNNLKYNQRTFLNPDDLPQPAWHLIDVEKYIRKKFYANRVLAINTSRGCPYKCAFCCVPRVHKGKWRAVSAPKIIENLKYLKDHYRIDGFQVDDEEFDIDKSRVLKLCDLLKSNNMNLRWSHFSRINIFKEEVLSREMECGLSLVEFGVESGSDRMLDFLAKGQSSSQILDAYAVCKKLRLNTSALFMIGLPTETERDLNDTVNLIKRLKSHLTICTIYRPYPGTELFDYCVSKKLFKYPERLKAVGAAYEQLTNMSEVPDDIIIEIKRYFDKRNIRNEIKFILIKLKLGLFFYYLFHYVLKPRQKALN